MLDPMHLISLGAGVQSSTMALMAACGEITPMPKAAIFADTINEPPSVYRWRKWLEAHLPFPIITATKGELKKALLTIRHKKNGEPWSKAAIPYFVANADGTRGHNHRQCTTDYKVIPITRAARALAGIKRGQKEIGCVQWIGISLDEMTRMKPSREPWCENRWPLIEMRITRQKCLDWMAAKGYPTPPRSACIFCPYRSNAEWQRLRVEEPESFAEAVNVEKELQRVKSITERKGGVPYLHPSLKPLDTIDFRSDVERGQGLLWQDECEGMCGV